MASPHSCFRGWQSTSHVAVALVSVLILSSARLSAGGRSLLELYKPPASALLTYHNGAVLQGRIPVSIIWYGRFTPAQKAVVTDFLRSLTTAAASPPAPSPSVSQWWSTIDQLYLSKARGSGSGGSARVALVGQATDEGCSLGKRLTLAQLPQLAARAGQRKGGIALVLTAQDVGVDGFCTSRCGLHGSDARAPGTAYVWVGNSATQCPGQCAWPFHRPLYGPQTPALVPPSGDVGADGMVINVASMVAGAVTNPFRDRARRTRRWRPPLPAQGSTAAAPTLVSQVTWRWTPPRGRATMPMARMGGSTCFRLCSTLQPLRVRLWCSKQSCRDCVATLCI
jgi:hypothetical protein